MAVSAGTSPGVQSHRNNTVMGNAVTYGGQSSDQATEVGRTVPADHPTKGQVINKTT